MKWVAPTWRILKATPPYNIIGVPRKRNMEEQIKIPEKELNDEEIDNLSHAEFKTLVIRMLTELVESGHKIEERLKAMESEINRTNSEGKETGTQINDLEEKEEINIEPKQNEEASIQKKMRRGLGSSGTILSAPILNHKGARRRRKQQAVENNFNKK